MAKMKPKAKAPAKAAHKAPVPKPAALKIERVKISSLTEDPRNARLHPDSNLTAITASLKAHGQQKPIVIDARGKVLAGNGTLRAALSLGWTEIDIVRTKLTGAAAAAYSIADNQTALTAEWDLPVLKDLLEELDTGALDMSATGFSAEELEAMMTAAPPEVTEDDIPENVPTRCKSGELWKLGDHRLLCGDSTKAEDVERVMDGKKATLLFTDPPYGVSIGAKNRLLNSFQKAGKNLADIESDELSPEELKVQLLAAFKTIYPQLADDCSVFVCSPQGGGLGMMMMMMQEACLTARHIIIWKKSAPTFSMGRLDYDYQHEPILFAWKKTHKRKRDGAHQVSVWDVDKPRASPDHPTTKPVELPANAILNHTDTGDIVTDIYLGSGTTLIAAEQLGRRCFGIEISPKYCDVVLARWEALTGKKAKKAA